MATDFFAKRTVKRKVPTDSEPISESPSKKKAEMKALNFRYGTSIMPTLTKNVIAKLPPHLTPIDPKKFDEEAAMEFSSNLSTTRRMGKNLEITGRYPSVSAILGAMEDDQTKLYHWQTSRVKDMGYSGFLKYMSQRTSSGTNFHNTIKDLLDELKKTGKISDQSCQEAVMVKAKEENRGYIEGIIPFLKNLPKTDWMAMEKATKNHYYCFQGRFDAIVEIDGLPTLVDWKTVSSASYKHHGVNDLKRLYGVPLQVVAYITAVNSDPDYSYMPRIKQGAVVLTYEDGRPAEVVKVLEEDLKDYYKILGDKLNRFWYKMMNPTKKDLDSAKNVNFVFNPALNPPKPKQPEVVVIDDEVIVANGSPSEDSKSDSKTNCATFETRTRSQAVESEPSPQKVANNNQTVFGI